MNFQVPQFIEVEDKVFGPFTFKQFIFLAGGAGGAFLVYSLNWPLFIKIFPITGIIVIALALAFYRVHNQPFLEVLEAGFKYTYGRKLYIWHKDDKLKTGQVDSSVKASDMAMPKLSQSRLKELAWSLDVKEKIH